MLKEQLPPDTQPLDSPSRDSKYGDRILVWCFLASIVINLGFGLWLNYADIYGEKRQADTNKVMKIATYKPPIKQKPKPKPKPKVIPPKPKIIPKIVHVQPRPTPPRPAPPQHFTVGTHSTSKTAIVVEPPSVPTPPQPVAPVQPENTTVQPTPPAPPPPAPTPPVKYVPPAPPAPVYHAPPAPKPTPPPPPPRPKNYLPGVDSRDASLNDSSIQTPDTSGMDSTSFTGPCVISFEVDENGRISGARIKKSSGNNEFDNKCRDAVQGGRGVPAVQDHIPYRARGEYTFTTS